MSRWPSWAPVPNKPTVYVAAKQHFNFNNYINRVVGSFKLLRFLRGRLHQFSVRYPDLANAELWCRSVGT